MKLIILPLMFSVACIAYQNRDRIAEQYHAAYPVDPAKEAALERCASESKGFNRLDGDDREYCYRKYIEKGSVAAAPVPAPVPVTFYPYSPSHLDANDIRRQEANDNYLQESMIKAAAARPITVIQTPASSPQHTTAANLHRLIVNHHVSPTLHAHQ
jgi:hypothetical protein